MELLTIYPAQKHKISQTTGQVAWKAATETARISQKVADSETGQTIKRASVAVGGKISQWAEGSSSADVPPAPAQTGGGAASNGAGSSSSAYYNSSSSGGYPQATGAYPQGTYDASYNPQRG